MKYLMIVIKLQHFGVIKGDGFWVTIEFTEFAAVYVAERVWNS